MKKDDGFIFIPKKWLGDAYIMAMDWDCKAMHLHLMALSWQKEPKGHLLDDDQLIRKLIQNPEENDWKNRIKPQIFKAWDKTIIKDEAGIEKVYWVQPALVQSYLKLNSSENESINIANTQKPKAKIKKTKLIEIENPLFDGFNLASIAKMSTKVTILYKQSSVEQSQSIWTLGAEYLIKHGVAEKSARGILAKWIKKYSAVDVASVMAELSIKNSQPADVISFVTKILEDKTIIRKPKAVTMVL